jgi:hypothetical protein
MPLRPALRRYWPWLLGITAFHVLDVFVPSVSANSTLMQVLFFLAALPAMWPLIFGLAPYSFWVVAALYWVLGFVLMGILRALLFLALGWQV